jgi:hypothetical protein
MKIAREEGGFGVYEDELPDDDYISAQANVSDEVVDGEARYAIDAVITTGAAPNELRDSLIVNCAGTYSYSGGKHLMRPGYYVPPSATLSEDDLAGSIQVSAFVGGDVMANEVQGSFVDPSAKYSGAPFGTQSVPATDIRQMDLELAYITSKSRAERVARIMLMRAQAEKTVTWPMNIKGLSLKAMDNVQLASDRYGLSNYVFQITDWALTPEYGVAVKLREEGPEIYEDLEPAAPVAVPDLAPIDVIETATTVSTLISTSSQVGLTITATATSITISNHTRRYNDKDVAVTGATISGLTAQTSYWLYYTDADRAGGVVTYTATTVYFDAFPSPANPTRHYAGYVTTGAVGGAGTSGGGSLPPGGGGSNPYAMVNEQ